MRVDSGALVLTVEDNAKASQSRRFTREIAGLLGMRERVLPFSGAIEVTGFRARGPK